MIKQIDPSKLRLNKANSSDTKAKFLDLNLCISGGFVSFRINDKCDDFDSDILNFPFLDGDRRKRARWAEEGGDRNER